MAGMEQKYTESTWAVFAGMRFILAAIVLIGHLHVFVNDTAGLRIISDFGARAAVLGFLLISGVSIGYSYKQNPDGYFRRRFLRIYPLYFFAVLLACVITVLVGSPYQLPGQTLAASGWKTALANFFFLQGILSITITYNGPLWTLGVEVFLYLFAPLLSKSRLELFLLLIAASMIAFLFYPRDWLFGYSALRYSWPWLIGFLSVTQQRYKLIALLLGIGVIVTSVTKTDTAEALSWVTFGAVSIVVVLANAYAFYVPRGVQKVLNFFGELSYPIYLFHFPLYIVLYRYCAVRSSYVFLLLTLLISLLFNYIVDYWLKRILWKPVVNWVVQRAKLR
jgi:peptidoglycan/LPS O-acetylase OafA/YrhL